MMADESSQAGNEINPKEPEAREQSILPSEQETIPGPSPQGAPGEPDSLPPPRVGARIGNYLITRELGHGGFGSVYEATDTRLERTVALKFLKRPEDETHRRLFEREAKAIAKLSKEPNVVEIYEWSDYGAQSYFVLEFVSLSASALLQAHPKGIAWRTALRIVRDCAKGLAAAHEAGIVHRDIKPANVLLESEQGPAKVADFGLTRLVTSSEATMIHGPSGSPPYMSPEQIRVSTDLDHRTDIFSLGVTLYELLSGARPFEGDTTDEVFSRIKTNVRIPLRERRSTLPEYVFGIVDKATAHDPNERYQTALELANDLEDALGERNIENITTISQDKIPLEATDSAEQPPEPSAKPRRSYWVGAGAIAACLLAAFVWFSPKPGETNTVLAAADEKLSARKAVEAQRMYEQVIEQDPENSRALYGLGYALFLQAAYEKAREAFQKTSDPLRNEGEAAIARQCDGTESAIATLERIPASAATPYTKALLAALYCTAGRIEEAAKELTALNEGDFPFAWQREDYLRAAARTYAYQGEYQRASELQATLQAARRREIEEKVEKLAERLQTMRSEPNAPPPLTDEEKWQSRPLCFFFAPAPSPEGLTPGMAELANVLTMLLTEELATSPRLKPVERDLIDAVLSEQSLSAALSSREGKIQLGEILGARLMVDCHIDRLEDHEYISTKLIDTQSTELYHAPRIDVKDASDAFSLMKRLAEGIVHCVQERYPIRGHATDDGSGIWLDVGRNVGVHEGMQFAVCTEPNADTLLPGASAVATAQVQNTRSQLKAEGLGPMAWPDTGLYLEEMVASPDTPE